MTLTPHTQNKMAGGSDDLYLFGEDFDAILGSLEEDEGLKEQFESSASDVSTKLGFFLLLSWLEHGKILSDTRAHAPT